MDVTDDRVQIIEAAEALALARTGDAEAFCRLTEPLQDRLLRQAAALSGDLAAAEDLVSETLVEAWKSLARYHESCRFSNWLCQQISQRLRNGATAKVGSGNGASSQAPLHPDRHHKPNTRPANRKTTKKNLQRINKLCNVAKDGPDAIVWWDAGERHVKAADSKSHPGMRSLKNRLKWRKTGPAKE